MSTSSGLGRFQGRIKKKANMLVLRGLPRDRQTGMRELNCMSGFLLCNTKIVQWKQMLKQWNPDVVMLVVLATQLYSHLFLDHKCFSICSHVKYLPCRHHHSGYSHVPKCGQLQKQGIWFLPHNAWGYPPTTLFFGFNIGGKEIVPWEVTTKCWCNSLDDIVCSFQKLIVGALAISSLAAWYWKQYWGMKRVLEIKEMAAVIHI